MAETWLTTREAATLWRVHQRTIVRWIQQGSIEGARLGRSYRVLAAAAPSPEVNHGEVQGQETRRERVDGEAG